MKMTFLNWRMYIYYHTPDILMPVEALRIRSFLSPSHNMIDCILHCETVKHAKIYHESRSNLLWLWQ